MNDGLTITWPVVWAAVGLFAVVIPTAMWVGKWITRTEALERTVKAMIDKMDERDERYTGRERRLNERLSLVEQTVARCPIGVESCPLHSKEG